MSIPHVHIMLNHIPVIGVLFCSLFFIISVILKNMQFQRVTSVLLILAALSAIPVFITGEPTEHVIEDIPTVSKHYIEEHEESAIASLIVMEILGGLSLLGLILSRKQDRIPGYVKNGIIIFSIISSVLIAYTAYLGGHIRHTEIRPDFQAPVHVDGGTKD
ncbi:MAG: hypothetical protein HZA08_08315 [Nitrospirae bacterium]|nr:hypothetical protein [Nitrospirota bacterium]